MKYERITSRNEEPFYAFDECKECEQKDGCDKWCAHTVGAYTRLHELEDKIESGELVDINQLMAAETTRDLTEKEIEFFIKHNEKVRKDTARDIFEYIYSILFNADFESGTVEMPLMKFIKKAREYGVNLFEEGETE